LGPNRKAEDEVNDRGANNSANNCWRGAPNSARFAIPRSDNSTLLANLLVDPSLLACSLRAISAIGSDWDKATLPSVRVSEAVPD
jgi:hypothetical protein